MCITVFFTKKVESLFKRFCGTTVHMIVKKRKKSQLD